MSSLMVRVGRTAGFRSVEEAINALAALAEEIMSTTRLGRLWTQFHGIYLAPDVVTFGVLFSQLRSFRADLPNQPTHVFPLAASPEAAGEVGFLSVNVRPDAPPDAAPGLTLSASLPGDAFDTGAEALQRLLERIVDAVSADVATIGPAAWLRELSTGWATFARHIRRDELPLGAIAVATRSGSIVIAHREEPASESASAREAVLRVRDSLSPNAPQTVAASPSPPPPRETPSAVTPATPSFLVARPLPTATSRRALASTVEGGDLPRGPALPFAPAACDTPELSRKGVRPPSQLTGTVDGGDAPQGPVLPFGPSAAPPEGPELTLEQYAHLRAQLTVRGEEDAVTWGQFGIDSRAVKEALQARFAARFREDPAAQARFVDLVQWRLAELRAR